MAHLKLFITFIFILASIPLELNAQAIIEFQKLLPQDLKGQFSKRFGESVAIDGNTAIIGIPSGGMNGIVQGMARIFEYHDITEKWVEVKTIGPSETYITQYFGKSVSISGDIAIIGSRHTTHTTIYYRNEGGTNNWGEVKRIERSSRSVSISGNTAIVGTWAGEAFIFSKDYGGDDNWGEEKKIIARDWMSVDKFGNSVSISGETAIVGAFKKEDKDYESGAAYIFSKNKGGKDNWGEVIKLSGSDTGLLDKFGGSVAVSGNLAIVGAVRNKIDNLGTCGSAYIFSKDHGGKDNWGEVKKLVPSDACNENFGSAHFGCSVSIDRDIIIIGSNFCNNQTGIAYIFQKDIGGYENWGQAKKVQISDLASNSVIGNSVCVSGNLALVGAPGGHQEKGSGSAYVIAKDFGGSNNWGMKNKLAGELNLENAKFGKSVSIYKDIAIVGVPGDDVNGKDSGAAFLFAKKSNKQGKWEKIKELRPHDGAIRDFFGSSVSINNDIIVVGAKGDDDLNGPNIGAAYIFSKHEGGFNNWGELTKIIGSESTARSQFGSSVSISDNIVIVGSAFTNQNNNNEIVFLFAKDKGGVNKWGQIKKIESNDFGFGDNLGISVSISGDTAIIGAGQSDRRANKIGSAYIIGKDSGGQDNWGLIKHIKPSNEDYIPNYGRSVSIHNQVVIVGAISKEGTKNGGAAFIYSKNSGGINNWGEVKMIKSSAPREYDQFGIAVSISDDTAIVGAMGNDLKGEVYVFYKNSGGTDNWGEVDIINGNDSNEVNLFGRSLAINGNTVLVGAHGDQQGGHFSGSSYVFHRLNNKIIDYLIRISRYLKF